VSNYGIFFCELYYISDREREKKTNNDRALIKLSDKGSTLRFYYSRVHSK
jgi:hypothetical protein